MKNPFIITPEEKEYFIRTIWGLKVQRYRTPVNVGIGRLIKRSLFNRCVQCGRDKRSIYHRKGDRVLHDNTGCPIHDFTPGFREQDYPVNPKH